MRTRYRTRVKMAHPKQGNAVRIRKDETIIQPKADPKALLRKAMAR